MKGYVCSEFLATSRDKNRCHICREPKSAHKPKEIIRALRGQGRKPQVKRHRISLPVFTAIVEALKDATPLEGSVHFTCKDDQHKECVARIATALARIAQSRKHVDIEEYINHFTFLIRGGF